MFLLNNTDHKVLSGYSGLVYVQAARIVSDFKQCTICRRPLLDDGPNCDKCVVHHAELGGSGLDHPLGVCIYGVNSRQSGRDMYRYKDEGAPWSRYLVGASLYIALRFHLGCLPGPQVDTIMWMPSLKHPDRVHPLRTVLDSVSKYFRMSRIPEPPIQDYLGGPKQRVAWDRLIDPNVFTIMPHRIGHHVLLIDDTWVTGSHMQSAAARLKQEGWGRVSGLVVARWVARKWGRDPSGMVDALYREDDPRFKWSPAYCPFGGVDCIAGQLVAGEARIG